MHTKERVARFWVELGTLSVPMTTMDALESYRVTLDRGYTWKGTETLRRIMGFVREEFKALNGSEKDIAFLRVLFEIGPWNMPTLEPVMHNLQRANEWTNTLGFVWAEALRKLGGFEAWEMLLHLAQTHKNFRAYFYRPNGGNLEPTIFLEDVLAEILDMK